MSIMYIICPLFGNWSCYLNLNYNCECNSAKGNIPKCGFYLLLAGCGKCRRRTSSERPSLIFVSIFSVSRETFFVPLSRVLQRVPLPVLRQLFDFLSPSSSTTSKLRFQRRALSNLAAPHTQTSWTVTAPWCLSLALGVCAPDRWNRAFLPADATARHAHRAVFAHTRPCVCLTHCKVSDL